MLNRLEQNKGKHQKARELRSKPREGKQGLWISFLTIQKLSRRKEATERVSKKIKIKTGGVRKEMQDEEGE